MTSIRSSRAGPVGAPVDESDGGEDGDPVGGSVGGEVGGPVGGEVGGPVDGPVGGEGGGPVDGPVGGEGGGPVDGPVGGVEGGASWCTQWAFVGQQLINNTRKGWTTVVVYLAHPLGPIPQGPVLKVLSGSLWVWPDSRGQSGSGGRPDVGGCDIRRASVQAMGRTTWIKPDATKDGVNATGDGGG